MTFSMGTAMYNNAHLN